MKKEQKKTAKGSEKKVRKAASQPVAKKSEKKVGRKSKAEEVSDCEIVVVEEVVVCPHAVARRAYAIYERRNFFGGHGTADTDWSEAEKQLREETRRK